MVKPQLTWLPLSLLMLLRFIRKYLGYTAISAAYIPRWRQLTARSIAFTEKSKVPTLEFEFFGRKIGYAVADRVGVIAQKVSSLPLNRIDAVFPAVMIRNREAHGPSRSRPHRYE